METPSLGLHVSSFPEGSLTLKDPVGTEVTGLLRLLPTPKWILSHL